MAYILDPFFVDLVEAYNAPSPRSNRRAGPISYVSAIYEIIRQLGLADEPASPEEEEEIVLPIVAEDFLVKYAKGNSLSSTNGYPFRSASRSSSPSYSPTTSRASSRSSSSSPSTSASTATLPLLQFEPIPKRLGRLWLFCMNHLEKERCQILNQSPADAAVEVREGILRAQADRTAGPLALDLTDYEGIMEAWKPFMPRALWLEEEGSEGSDESGGVAC